MLLVQLLVKAVSLDTMSNGVHIIIPCLIFPEHNTRCAACALISSYALSKPLNLVFSSRLQSAHLAMIDTLMMAYTVEIMSVEKVVASIQQYPSFSPEVETPYDTEDAVTVWINRVSNISSLHRREKCHDSVSRSVKQINSDVHYNTTDIIRRQ